MKTKKDDSVHSVNVVTLGCSKNLVDSEYLLKQFKYNNLQIKVDENTFADLVIINTCGFILDAKEESIDNILQWVGAKKQGKIKKLIVMGCLSERYKGELQEEIPEIDGLFGVNQFKEIINSLNFSYQKQLVNERFITTPNHYAYLKISEGCDRTCAFCAIPSFKGKYTSRTLDEICKEAEFLSGQGTKELILIAQDLTYYGIDLYKKPMLAELLNSLDSINGIKWIRLHYAYPASFPMELIQIMQKNPKICRYLDIPFQHVNDNLLRNMRRGYRKKDIENLIDQLRSKIPGIALRTSFITGYPGEGEREFEELAEFINTQEFERLGVFTYSHEDGTFAAEKYLDEIPFEEKLRRKEKLMQIQQGISLKKNKEKIGQEIEVIVDREEGDLFIGRTQHDSPEVDNEVLITSGKKLSLGKFYKVRIHQVDEFDLYASI
ncbi:MAG: 30S ribosomal protein S12 methylthiotransferase RimO [bacterium]